MTNIDRNANKNIDTEVKTLQALEDNDAIDYDVISYDPGIMRDAVRTVSSVLKFADLIITDTFKDESVKPGAIVTIATMLMDEYKRICKIRYHEDPQ